MKVRMGFVSNSSSSSFMIMGICMELDEAKEILLEKVMTSEKVQKRCDVHCKEDLKPYLKGNRFRSVLNEAFSDDMDVEGSYEDDYVYFGLSVYKMKDDETLREFKERVQKQLEKIGIKSDIKSLDWQEDCWQDG